jgi:hypothetical protein
MEWMKLFAGIIAIFAVALIAFKLGCWTGRWVEHRKLVKGHLEQMPPSPSFKDDSHEINRLKRHARKEYFKNN